MESFVGLEVGRRKRKKRKRRENPKNGCRYCPKCIHSLGLCSVIKLVLSFKWNLSVTIYAHGSSFACSFIETDIQVLCKFDSPFALIGKICLLFSPSSSNSKELPQ